MKSYKQIYTESIILENSKAFKELKTLIKNDKDVKKNSKNKVDFLDYIYQKYEKQITKIEKKYSLGMDELGQLLLKL